MSDQSQLLEVFREEADQLTDKIAEGAERLSQLQGPERKAEIEHVMRCAHNLKGAAGTVGVPVVELLAHAIESALVAAPLEDPLNPALISAILRATAAAQAAACGNDLGELLDQVLADLGAAPSQPADLPPPRRSGERVAGTEHAQGIRVDRQRLDRLMGFTGELLVAHARRNAENRLLQALLLDAQRALLDEDRVADPFLDSLVRRLRDIAIRYRDDLLSFGHLTGELHHAMKTVRMMPLKGLEPVLRRIVRESAQQCAKNVRIEMNFGEIELDKEVLDGLRDPLMHLLRNAVDHGIEPADERVSKGKPEQGCVNIEASARGTTVLLNIEDDGRGLDWERIREQAVLTGVVDRSEADALDPQVLADIIFRPGFSTASTVTRQSGRGVGLDVVRGRIEHFGGQVTCHAASRLGGARFMMETPVSVLSSVGFLVRAGATIFAIPVESVERAMPVRSDQLRRMDDSTFVVLEGGQPARFETLAGLLGATEPDPVRRLVLLSHRGKMLSLGVADVLGEREFVTQRLPWMVESLPGVNGAIILEDGTLAVLLDVGFLFQRAGRGSPAPETPNAPTAASTKKILVVDDSLTMRAKERDVLASAGYDVTIAVDGTDAWNLLEQRDFDLVVSDVEMPAPDGYELTRRIRAHQQHRDLPVVLVTARSSPEDRAMGIAAGADEYLVKGQFQPRELLDAVAKYL